MIYLNIYVKALNHILKVIQIFAMYILYLQVDAKNVYFSRKYMYKLNSIIKRNGKINT